jgi:hypothetical protein
LSNFNFAKLLFRLNWGRSISIYPNGRILIENPVPSKASRKNGLAKKMASTNSQFDKAGYPQKKYRQG